MSGLAGPTATKDLDPNALPTRNHGPKCFRIAGVPLTWSEHDLLHTLQTIDSSLEGQNPQLSLFPACCGPTQTALLNLDTCTEYFRRLKPNKFNYEQITEAEALLVIDSHFYDLTPLNTPEGEVVADVVAVTGLAGHAFGSWRSRETRLMWLKDFLPKDVKGIRIMTYGYDSNLVGHKKSDTRLADYRRNFIQQLENSRSSAKGRPIIFLGHSLGGILVLQTLIESNRNPHHRSILDSTHGIFFFGTPHHGLRTDELEEMVDTDSGGERRNLIMQLKEGSEYLEDQKEDLLRIWEGFKRKVVSFYETVKTPSVRKLESGECARDGVEVQMVQRFSAQLYLPSEYRLPVEKNHTDIVKFASQVDTTYQTVVRHMKDFIAQCSQCSLREMLLSVINGVDPDHFLCLLSVVDQTRHMSTIRPLDYDQPKFYWILKNCDFTQWNSGNSPVLWLSGPTECSIDQVSLNTVHLEMGIASGSRDIVLYFFCSTVVTTKPTITVFVHTLIHQFICYLAPDRRGVGIAAFLQTLLDSISHRKPSRFKEDDPPDTTLKKILDAPSSDLWAALKAALGVGQERKLSIIIDGLDRVEQQRLEFIKGLNVLVTYLLERPLKPKVLLTSRPQADIKEILGGLLCIEYDKERKECLNTLRFDNTRYEKISEEHEGSLQWLWVHDKYRAWSSASSSDLLLIEGKPGSGKSTLTKYFKRNLLKRESLASQATVASFFYSYWEGELQTNHSSMLRSILFDVLNQNESFFFHFQLYYRAALKSGTHFQWPYCSLKNILLSFRDHPVAERLFLIMDGMDESNIKDRRDIVRLLGQVCSTKNVCIVKTFLASRPINELNRHTHKVIKLQDENKSDISEFVGSFLGSDLDLPSEILRQATEYIVENAQGVFIWVHLVKEELIKYTENGCSRGEIFAFLRSLPTELEGFYKRILDELEKREERDIRDGLGMFRFVLFAYRPLRLEELRQALAIPDDLDIEFSSSDQSFEDKVIHGIDKRIIHCGGNFLEIKGARENSSVQVMHQTVREFFRPGGPTAMSKFQMSGDSAHIRISITCIRYLMLCAANTTFTNELPNSEPWPSGHFEDYARYLNKRPFINYALSYLKEHLHKCGQVAGISKLVSQLCEQLTNNPTSYLLESWVASNWSQTLTAHEQRDCQRF